LSVDALSGRSGLWKEAPQTGGADVAKDRTGPTGENGSHPLTFITQSSVPDGIDTSMDAVKTVGANPRSSALPMYADALELAERDHTVLSGRNTSDRGVRVELCTHLGA
jgi:hypothetical protein